MSAVLWDMHSLEDKMSDVKKTFLTADLSKPMLYCSWVILYILAIPKAE